MSDAANQQATPQPRRRRRIRRTVLLGLVIAIAVFETYAYLAMHRAMADARAGGRPLTFEEIEKARTTWPPDRNGAAVLLAMRDRLEQITESKNFDQLPIGCGGPEQDLGERWSEPQRADVAQFLRTVSAELEQIDRFRYFRGGRLPFDTKFNLLTSEYKIGFLRTAMKLKSLQVMDRTMAGNTAPLVDDLGIMLNMNRVLAEEPLIIGSLVRCAGDASVVATLQGALALNTLRPEQLIAIDGLLGGIESDKRLYWGMLGERACFLPACEYTLNQSVGARIESHLPIMHAWLLGDRAAGLRMWKRQVEAAADPDHSLKIADEIQREVERVPRIWILARTLVPCLHRSYELDARLTAKIRAARTAMAVERFRLDRGQFPTSLEQLVPAYMEKVPVDPFVPQPMQYRLTSEQVVIYSVGEDLKDNDGDVGPKTNKDEKPKDCGFVLLPPELRGRAPTTATATATAPDAR